MTQKHKLLIIGGYGTFGGRLARLLMNEKALEILVAGRSLQKARAFAQELDGAATVTAVKLDRSGDLDAAFSELNPDIVVDASGPFQNYGERAYRVVEAALASGCHYLDLADDRDFVLGIHRFDPLAKKAGLFALSGASSCPALTSAVYRRITRDFASVRAVTGGIAPSPYAGVGPNVIRAIASYAGQPITLRRGGRDATAFPFTETRRRTVGPPGTLPLRSLAYSLVDVPDLNLLGTLDPKPDSVWFGAAPVPTLYHACFRLLARAVKRGLLRTLAPIAPLMSFVMNHLSWGEHRGGLFLECEGLDVNGRQKTRSWHLLAEGSIGPMTPTLACVAVLRKMLAGAPPAPGARPAHLDLELTDFEPLFAKLGVQTGERESSSAEWPLFRRVLGNAWSTLPAPVASVHEVLAEQKLAGRASVIRGRSLVARAAAALFRFPLAGDQVPVTVTMNAGDGGEYWLRNFSGRTFSSTLSAGRGAWAGLVRERFGIVSFGMALVVENDRLLFVMRRWSVAGIPMPLFLRPKGMTFESVVDQRFCFDVEITFPIVGHIVTYRGWLEPVRP